MLALWAFIPITMLSFYITPHPKITLSAPPRQTYINAYAHNNCNLFNSHDGAVVGPTPSY